MKKEKLNIEEQLFARMKRAKSGTLFFPEQFGDLAESTAIRKALQRLTEDGNIVRVAQGIYVIPKESSHPAPRLQRGGCCKSFLTTKKSACKNELQTPERRAPRPETRGRRILQDKIFQPDETVYTCFSSDNQLKIENRVLKSMI